MPKLGCALTASREDARRMIEECVSSSKTLADAMESVGAMYGIPSSNILTDNNLKSIKVVEDNIIVPGNIKASGNENAIVRSISSVLDQISKRVDDKVNDAQMHNIRNGQHDESILNRTDPSKGKVVMTDVDANGDPIIVYDSGIIDCAHTPEGRAKANQIRERENIPAMHPLQKQSPSYFNDEDDIRNGVDMTVDNKKSQPVTEYSLSDLTNTPGYFIDAIAKFGDTRTLGYDIFTKHGYDCVQPVSDMYTESTGQTINPEDIKHMKFDNSNIVKAIELLNKARSQQNIRRVVDLNIDSLVNSTEYKEAIKCLERQFDCRLAIKWIASEPRESMTGTAVFDREYRTRLTCSKSKGFQLGGAPIHIYIIGDELQTLVPDDPTLFGQGFIAIILHEIFHNIAGIMRYQNGQFITSLNITLAEAAGTRDPKTRRVIINKYVDALNRQFGGKINRAMRRQLVRQLNDLVTVESDAKLATQYHTVAGDDTEEKRRERAESELKSRTKAYQKLTKKYRPKPGGGITALVIGGVTTIASIISFALHARFIGVFLLLGSIGLLTAGGIGVGRAGSIKRLQKLYKNSKEMEEYYADLFAGMYQLPQRFYNAASRSKFTANQVSQETLNEWVKVEKCAYESLLLSDYPTTSERTYAGVRIAKKLLENKELDPSIEHYLRWIVENHDQILKTGIKEDYNKHTFDPEEAEDLDKHTTSMIANNKVALTEAFVDDSEYELWLEQSCDVVDDYDAFMVEYCALVDHIAWVAEMIDEGFYDSAIDDVVMEGSYNGKVTGYKDESIIKRMLLLIPRLIGRCLDLIVRFVKRVMTHLTIGTHSMIVGDKRYKFEFDPREMESLYTRCGDMIDKIYDTLDGAADVNDYINRIKKLAKLNVGDITNKVPKKDTEILGKEVTRIMKHIADYSRTDMSPKLNQLITQFDRISNKSKSTWDSVQTDATVQAGYNNYRKVIEVATDLVLNITKALNKLMSDGKSAKKKDSELVEDKG